MCMCNSLQFDNPPRWGWPDTPSPLAKPHHSDLPFGRPAQEVGSNIWLDLWTWMFKQCCNVLTFPYRVFLNVHSGLPFWMASLVKNKKYYQYCTNTNSVFGQKWSVTYNWHQPDQAGWIQMNVSAQSYYATANICPYSMISTKHGLINIHFLRVLPLKVHF